MKGIDFLDVVYGDRVGWISLPARTNGKWIERNYLWPESRQVVEAILRDADASEEDTYFSVLQFKTRGRKEANAMGAAWLWADLDEVNPGICAQHGLSPTWVWETSDGRYQGLWSLDRRLKTTGLAKLNRALTMKLGADPGGWDLTQVLRVPGTHNWKRGGKDIVRMVGSSKEHYETKQLAGILRPYTQAPTLGANKGSGGNGTGHISPRARALLKARESVTGERSARLWELECLLAEGGFDEEGIYNLVKESVWYEHWRERGNGGERGCRREIGKAIAKVSNSNRAVGVAAANGGGRDAKQRDHTTTAVEGAQHAREAAGNNGGGNGSSHVPGGGEVERLPIESYGRFLSRDLEAPRWLIDGIWTAESHGIIGGEPKTSKSLIALSLALCVASGKPWMKKYKTYSQGSALVIQEENTPWLTQDRLRKLARYHGLIHSGSWLAEQPGDAASRLKIRFPRDYPLNIVNNFGTSLYEEKHRDMIESAVRTTGARLLVLDPLYLMADESTSTSLRPVLQWLLWLRYEYKCAIVVVHHFKKGDTAPGAVRVQHGQRLLGSMTLHAWLESALYCEKRDMEGAWMQTRIHREFRNVGPRSAIDLKVLVGEPGSLDFDVQVGTRKKTDELEAAVKSAGDKGMRLAQLAKDLAVDKRTLTRALNLMVEQRKVTLVSGGMAGTKVIWVGGRRRGKGARVSKGATT